MSDGSDNLDLGQAAAEAVAKAFQAERAKPLAFAAELLLEALSQNSGWEDLVRALSAEEFNAVASLASPALAARLRQARG